jgi:hypothetical protein
MLSVATQISPFAECRYAECHYAECRGAKITHIYRLHKQKIFTKVIENAKLDDMFWE